MRIRIVSAFALLLALAAPGAASARALRVVVTVPDLADLTHVVGGDAVDVTALVKGPQDPHFVEPRPTFVTRLHRADLFIEAGLELEIGWSPKLLQSARNAKVRPGGAGYLNASTAIAPLQVPTGTVDRSMGDVHPYGNPHYLLDPLNGLRVARRIAETLSALAPDEADAIRARSDAFARRLMEHLVGSELASRHAPAALADAIERNQLDALLAEAGETAGVGGWLGTLPGAARVPVAQDHRIYTYFARRFGLVPVIALEPKPGIAPTTAHIASVIRLMRDDAIPLILTTPYFDPRHAERVAEKTGARVVPLAHQVGAREGTDDYLMLIDYNVRHVAEGLSR